jgi:hypothetical protein
VLKGRLTSLGASYDSGATQLLWRLGVYHLPAGIYRVSALIRGIRSRVIDFRYRQRQQAIIQDILALSARPNVEPALQRYKLDALERHLPSCAWPFTAKARTLVAVRRHLASGDLLALKEALADWQCFTEDL